jgi:hypothetical protein
MVGCGAPGREAKCVVSRVPKCEAPGAPRFREKVNLNGTRATRPGESGEKQVPAALTK